MSTLTGFNSANFPGQGRDLHNLVLLRQSHFQAGSRILTVLVGPDSGLNLNKITCSNLPYINIHSVF